MRSLWRPVYACRTTLQAFRTGSGGSVKSLMYQGFAGYWPVDSNGASEADLRV